MTAVTNHDHLKLAIRHLRQSDRALGEVIARVGACTIKPYRHRFAALVWSIISQQISTRAAASIKRRLRDAIAPARLTPGAILSLTPHRLLAVGLSGQKARYIRDLAEKVNSRQVDLSTIHRHEDEIVIERLTLIKGIGRWTAEMFLIFSLGRLNVLPVDDLGLRAAVQRLDALPELPLQAFVRERGRVWRPYCSVATWYLWQSLKAPK